MLIKKIHYILLRILNIILFSAFLQVLTSVQNFIFPKTHTLCVYLSAYLMPVRKIKLRCLLVTVNGMVDFDPWLCGGLLNAHIYMLYAHSSYAVQTQLSISNFVLI